MITPSCAGPGFMIAFVVLAILRSWLPIPTGSSLRGFFVDLSTPLARAISKRARQIPISTLVGLRHPWVIPHLCRLLQLHLFHFIINLKSVMPLTFLVRTNQTMMTRRNSTGL